MSSGTNEREPLSAALDAIADGAARAHERREPAGGGLDLAVVRTAAGRRRVRFGAGVGLAAAGVVGALVLGGAALARIDPAPAPPAGTTAPQPTSAVTPEPTAEPGVVPDLPGCGGSTSALEPTMGPVAAAQLELRVGVLDTETGEFLHEGFGDALAVSVLLYNAGPDLLDVGAGTAQVVVAQGDVAVLTTAIEADSLPTDWPSAQTHSLSAVLDAVPCSGPGALPPGDYVLWVRTSLTAAEAPGAEPQEYAVVAPPVPFTVYDFEDPDNHGPVTYTVQGEAGWADVDPATVPGALAFTNDPDDVVIRSQAYQDGNRWRVTVSYAGGRDTYERARDATVAAGFALVSEDTDPERPLWRYAQLRRDDLLVTLEVSNESGGGFYGDWLVVRTG